MKKWVSLALLLACAAFQHARAADWKMDALDSKLEFVATFENAPAPGVFKEFDVRLRFDPEKLAGSLLDVTIRVASADMANADINKTIAGAEWFDFARHQQAEFHAADIRRSQTNLQSRRYVARGTLALKSVQQPVEVVFGWSAAGGGAVMEGEFTVKRGPFGIGTGEWAATDVIGPDVAVKFRVRLRRVN